MWALGFGLAFLFQFFQQHQVSPLYLPEIIRGVICLYFYSLFDTSVEAPHILVSTESTSSGTKAHLG